MSMMSWSVPTRVDNHLQTLSRNEEGRKSVEDIVDGLGIDDMDGAIGDLDESPVIDI